MARRARVAAAYLVIAFFIETDDCGLGSYIVSLEE